jgi:phosphoribosylanthranilate isomerase
MPTKVKICGLKTVDALDAALDAGADYVGLVVYPPSPRYVAPKAAAPLADRARGRSAIVALVVDADDDLIDQIITHVRPDVLQLQGRETPSRTAAIRARTGCPIMKAVPVASEAEVRAASVFETVADLILFDAKAPAGATGMLPGGNGLTFDWQILAPAIGRFDFVLAGGLTAANVATAIRLARPYAVDVSSGVESSPGIKDAERIRAFLAAARAA